MSWVMPMMPFRGGAQFVAHVGQELALHAVGHLCLLLGLEEVEGARTNRGLEVRVSVGDGTGHGTETPSEVSELVVPIGKVEFDRVVSAREAHGGLLQGAQGQEHLAAQDQDRRQDQKEGEGAEQDSVGKEGGRGGVDDASIRAQDENADGRRFRNGRSRFVRADARMFVEADDLAEHEGVGRR